MSKRQFVSTILLLVLANLVVKAIFIFGIDMQVQQEVGLSEYGLYFTLLNLCFIFQMINDFGLNLIHNTDTAEHGYIRRDRWVHILRLKVVLAVCYSVIVTIVALALGYMHAWHLLGWLILNNILVSLIMILRAGISGSAKYKTEAIISVLDKALMILICGFLLIQFDGFRIEWFVWSQTASLVITAAVAWLVSSRFISTIKSTVEKFEFSVIIRSALPFALMTFLMFAYTRIDNILLEKLHPEGVQAVGVYAIGLRLLDAANMIAFLFGPLLIPMYVRLRNERNETMQLMHLASGMMLFLTGMISVGCFFWAWPIIEVCYGNAEVTWVTTFRLLILSHIPVGLMYIFGSYLTAMHQMRHQNILFGFSVALNLVLNFVLIPKWGTKGAATSALITQSVTTIGLIILTQGKLKLKPDLPYLLKAGSYFTILAGSAWILETSILPWMLEMMMFCFVAVITAFLFRLLQWSSFAELIRKREEIPSE